VSLVKPGSAFQIATNVASKRKTPALVAFYAGDRVFGSDAESLAARKPRVTVADAHKLLGRNATHPGAVAYAGAPGYYGLALGTNARGGRDVLLPTDDTGDVPPLPPAADAGADAGGASGGGLFSSLLGGGAKGSAAAAPEGVADGAAAGGGGAYPPAGYTSFSAEELSAQVLEHVRGFTEDFAGGARVRDAVITVPAYATQGERLALLDAAELAGFHVLALLDENTAAGVHYGIDRVTENGTHHMLLYNMGAEATQVTLFAYDSYVARSMP